MTGIKFMRAFLEQCCIQLNETLLRSNDGRETEKKLHNTRQNNAEDRVSRRAVCLLSKQHALHSSSLLHPIHNHYPYTLDKFNIAGKIMFMIYFVCEEFLERPSSLFNIYFLKQQAVFLFS